MITAPVRLTIAAVVVVALALFAGIAGLFLMIGGLGGDTASDEALLQAQCSPIGIVRAVNPTGDTRNPITGGYVVTSEYGMRVHPVLRTQRLHAGIDMAQSGGSGPIVAAADGRVVYAGYRSGGGNVVELDHGGGFETRYLHMSSLAVEVGQDVAAGEQIGVEGSTGGISTGAHLHFETRFDGQPRNPREWFAEQGIDIPGSGGSGSAPGPGKSGSDPVQAGADPQIEQAAFDPSDAASAGSVSGYSGEQLVNAGHIIKQGQTMGLDQWTVTVAVMTSMGESDLINVDYGDKVGPDSRGLFQQRAAGWGSYADRMNPKKAAKSFYEALVAVPGYTDLAPTIAAHRAQRNADPYHYEKDWQPAVRVVAVLSEDDEFLSQISTSGTLPSSDCAEGAEGITAGGGSFTGGGGGPIGSCPASGSPAESGLKPNALRLLRCTVEQYPTNTIYGVGERSGKTEHDIGEAVDFMIDDFRSSSGNAEGQAMADWVVANADDLDVKYVIFDMRVWLPSSGWVPYDRYGNTADDTLAHRDHVHVSVNAAGSSARG